MNMLLCQITTIAFVIYASLNTVAYIRLRSEVKKHKEVCKARDEQNISATAK